MKNYPASSNNYNYSYTTLILSSIISNLNQDKEAIISNTSYSKKSSFF